MQICDNSQLRSLPFGIGLVRLFERNTLDYGTSRRLEGVHMIGLYNDDLISPLPPSIYIDRAF